MIADDRVSDRLVWSRRKRGLPWAVVTLTEIPAPAPFAQHNERMPDRDDVQINLTTIVDRDQANNACRSRYGTFSECQLCGGPLTPEHAHFKCRACGWRDSCCD